MSQIPPRINLFFLITTVIQMKLMSVIKKHCLAPFDGHLYYRQ